MSIARRFTIGSTSNSFAATRRRWRMVPDTGCGSVGYRRAKSRSWRIMFPYLHAAELLKLLPDDKAADVLQAMSVERQRQVIEEFDDDEASRLLMRMSPDLAADLTGQTPARDDETAAGTDIRRNNSDRIVELLRYPENTVGGVMINNMIS